MPKKYSIFPGVVFEVFWPDAWQQSSKTTTPRFTLFRLLTLSILLFCLLSCQLVDLLLSTFRMVRAARIVKLAVLTIEELFFSNLPLKISDITLLSSDLDMNPKDEAAYPILKTYQNIIKPRWLTGNDNFVLRYYGQKIDPSAYTGTDEERSEYNSSTHSRRQSTKYGGVSWTEKDLTLQNLPAFEAPKNFEFFDINKEEFEDPLQYQCQKKSFDRTSHLLWNESMPKRTTISPVVTKADVCSIEMPITAAEQSRDLVIEDAARALKTDSSMEKIPDGKYQQHSNTSPEKPRTNTYPVSDAGSPRRKSLHDRNHFRRRRASPIPVTELVKKATKLKMFEFRDFVPESTASKESATGELLDENIEKTRISPSSPPNIFREVPEKDDLVTEKISVSSSPLHEVFREAPEKDDFVADILKAYVDSVHSNSPSRSSSTSTDEDDFDNRFRVLNPHMPCPGLFPGPEIMHKRPTSSASNGSESKMSPSNGNSPKRVGFVEESEDTWKESNSPETRVFKAETIPLFELPAYEITDSKEQSLAAEESTNTDSVRQKDINNTTPSQMDFTFPPLPPTPNRQIRSTIKDFEIHQDESGQCADEESTQILPLVAPMKSKIPITRKSFKTKSSATGSPLLSGSQDRPFKHASSKSSPLRQPPLTIRSLNHYPPEAEADVPDTTTAMSLSQDEWPSLPRHKADDEPLKSLSSKSSRSNIRQPIFVCPGASKRDVEDGDKGLENTNFVAQTQPTKPGRIELYQAFFGDDPDDSTEYVFD